jgi:tetratricopeptide (TPR) repeat protein
VTTPKAAGWSDPRGGCAGVGVGGGLRSLLAKRPLYSGKTGQARLEAQLGSAEGVESVLKEVKAVWEGGRVPGGALEALRWSICRDRGLRASWGTLLAKLARPSFFAKLGTLLAKLARAVCSPSFSPSSSSSPVALTAARAAAEYVRGLSKGERELIEVEEAIERVAGRGGEELGRLWLRKGRIHKSMEQHVQAERAYEAALTTQRAHLPPNPTDIATSLNNLAALYEAKGEYDRALPLYEEALESTRAALPLGHPDIATSLNNTAGLYEAKGEYDRALPLYEEALVTGPPRHRHLAQQHCRLVQVQGRVRPGEYDRALPLYEEALEIRREALPPGHPDIASSLANLACLYDAKGEYDRALPLLEQALEIKREALPPGHQSIAFSLNNLAKLYQSKGEYDRALPLYEEALEVYEKALPPSHPSTTTCLHDLTKLYEAVGRHEEARQVRARAGGGGAVA